MNKTDLTAAMQQYQHPMVRTVSGKPVDIKNLSYPIATNKNLQAYAFDQVKFEKQLPLHILMAYGDNGQPVDLTSKVNSTGSLDWTAPPGNWTPCMLCLRDGMVKWWNVRLREGKAM